jgi:hypothetical protein
MGLWLRTYKRNNCGMLITSVASRKPSCRYRISTIGKDVSFVMHKNILYHLSLDFIPIQATIGLCRIVATTKCHTSKFAALHCVIGGKLLERYI